jgi:hypothetical protein
MVAVTFDMTMMVTAQFSMIKRDADTKTTIAAMSFNFNHYKRTPPTATHLYVSKGPYRRC